MARLISVIILICIISTGISRGNYKKELIKKTLMDLFGLTEEDMQIKERPKIPLPLWKLYLKWKDEDYESLDKINADVVSFIHHDMKEKNSSTHSKSCHIISFELNFTDSKSLYKAELLLQSTKNSLSKSDRLTVTDRQNKTIAVKRVANLRKSETSIDVTQQVREQLEKNNNALTLGISRLPNLHIRRSRDISDKHWVDKRPILLVYRKRSEKIRKKRTATFTSRPTRLTRECGLKHLTIDTSELNGVVEPRLLPLNMCAGECQHPLGRAMNTTNHAIIRSHVQSVYGESAVQSVCCVPISFVDVTFLIRTSNGGLGFQQYPNVTATACGCR